MTVVEKAAYLKGLCEGLGVEPESKEGKLWGALCDLVSDMAHEIEELSQSNTDFADALDEIGEELSYLEELTCDLDVPEDMMDGECIGDCSCCCGCEPFDGEDEDQESEDGEDDGDGEELSFDGVLYDVVCPKCGEEITFDEDTLNSGSTTCPKCGEHLEFDLSEDGEDIPF